MPCHWIESYMIGLYFLSLLASFFPSIYSSFSGSQIGLKALDMLGVVLGGKMRSGKLHIQNCMTWGTEPEEVSKAS